jgi:hypothetical protein
VVVPEAETAAAPVGDLMEALRASLEAARSRKGGDGAGAAKSEGERSTRKPSRNGKAQAAKPAAKSSRRKSAA